MQAAMPVTHIVLPARQTPVKLQFDTGEKLSEKEYLDFCRANPDLRLERTTQGEIVIVPPAGFESSHRNGEVTAQLVAWAGKDGRGIACDSSAEFILPDGSALSPDAAWVSNESLRRLTRQQK